MVPTVYQVLAFLLLLLEIIKELISLYKYAKPDILHILYNTMIYISIYISCYLQAHMFSIV